MVLSTATIRLLGLPALVLLMAGCTRVDNYADLQAFVVEVRSRPGAEVEPVPEFVPYEGFIYSAASMRSPFEIPLIVDGESTALMSQNVQPDFDRPREPLENQALSSMNMVGMLVRDGNYQALIEDAVGVVHRVSVGNYLGRNHGRIESITDTQVGLIEIVPSGNGGWVERPQTLTLQ
ncbi:MAG: pilus assembly protein PilP [Pseudohongiellaceae bacterium]|jgi:type IV pilus assembly protein PilP